MLGVGIGGGITTTRGPESDHTHTHTQFCHRTAALDYRQEAEKEKAAATLMINLLRLTSRNLPLVPSADWFSQDTVQEHEGRGGRVKLSRVSLTTPSLFLS